MKQGTQQGLWGSGFLGSMRGSSTGPMMALVASVVAVVAVGVFVLGPLPATGQAPAKGDAPPIKGGAPGAPGGKGGGKQAVPAGPVPRTKEGHPDMSGFWGGVTPSASVSIEPAQAKGGAAPKSGGAPGGPGAGKGGPGGGAPGGAAVAGGPGAGKGGPGGAPTGGGAPGAGAAKQQAKGLIIDPADGRVPYTVAARAKSDDIIANRMFLEPELHCFPSGVPHTMWLQFGLQTVQTKDYMVMMWEIMHTRRIIPLDNRPHVLPDSVRQFQGEAVGHWEGDTLVIDTTNQTDKTWFDTSGHYAPRDARVVERLTMVNSNSIDYEATITSAEFTQPMKLKGTIARANVNDPAYEQMEFACIEGNQDLAHYTEDKGGKQKNVGARTK